MPKGGEIGAGLGVAESTGIHRMTLSKLANHRGYNPTADVLDRLCNFFSCRIEQLVEHVPGLTQDGVSIAVDGRD